MANVARILNPGWVMFLLNAIFWTDMIHLPIKEENVQVPSWFPAKNMPFQ